MFTNSTTMVQNKVLFKKLPYDPDKDFALVAWFNTGHLPTMVNKDVPVKNIAEFAAWAREQQGLARDLRRRLVRPYRGRDAEPPLRAQDGGGALSRRGADVAGRGFRRPCRARAAATRSATGRAAGARRRSRSRCPRMVRMKKLPDVATFYEQGLTEKAFQVRGWVGCAAPAGTPPEVVQKLSAADGRGRQDRGASRRSSTPSASTRARATAPTSARSSTRKGPVSIEVIKSLGIEPQ